MKLCIRVSIMKNYHLFIENQKQQYISDAKLTDLTMNHKNNIETDLTKNMDYTVLLYLEQKVYATLGKFTSRVVRHNWTSLKWPNSWSSTVQKNNTFLKKEYRIVYSSIRRTFWTLTLTDSIFHVSSQISLNFLLMILCSINNFSIRIILLFLNLNK